jgi:hypothetical protein
MPNPDLSVIACPGCGTIGSLELKSRLHARPIGSFSLAGQQMKVSAVAVHVLACTADDCEFVKYPSGWSIE